MLYLTWQPLMTIDLHIQTYFKNYIYFNSGTKKQKPPVKDKAYLDEILCRALLTLFLPEKDTSSKAAAVSPGREERGEKADRKCCLGPDSKEGNLFLYLQ